ncbi:MAG: sulfite exporter TauE/SafE family protein [Thermoanaerobaculia bacterium]|nr:sulfite exporter TauE/SafE family protein [Thermoanaerobaculia bacterium]
MSWLGALAIGLSLGLLGSGGSILTVPVLVYLVGEPEKVAIAESLAIVGLIAAAAAVPNARRGLVRWRTVLLFGVPGMAGSYLGAAAARYVDAAVQLSLFAAIMLLAAVLMFRPPRLAADEGAAARPVAKIALEGLLVGLVTGLVGVGGGFLIVPALVLLGGLPIHTAIGTSLVIIALKSLAGFLKYRDVLAGLELTLDWSVIAGISAVGFAGTLAGAVLARRLPRALLQRVFAAFLVAMGAFILWQYAPRVFGG